MDCDCHCWCCGTYHRHRLRAVPVDRDLTSRVVWFVWSREKEDRARRFYRLTVGDGCSPAIRARILDLLGHCGKDYGMDAACTHVRRTTSFRRGNCSAAALFCAGGRPNVAVRTRLRTIHRADDHAVIKRVCVQGISLAGSTFRLRAHLDIALRIRCSIGTKHEIRKGELIKRVIHQANGIH